MKKLKHKSKMNYDQTKNLIGRTLISAIFIYTIPVKIFDFKETIENITSQNITAFAAPFLLVCAILCLIFGTIFFISGFKQRLGSSLLLIFIIPTTFIFHIFPFQIKAILMNFGFVGGLMLGL